MRATALGGPAPASVRGSLAVVDVRVYPRPDSAPLDRATVLVRDGSIAAVGSGVEVPPGTAVLPGGGGTLTAGFWNVHVHFTESKWRNARHAPAAVLERQVRDMLTGHGFTTVVDTGSDPRVTLPLRQRVESGELAGPRIYTSGPGLYPPYGLPYYLRPSLPFYLRPFLPQPRSRRSARRVVERTLSRGAEIVKLFTGSYVERGVIRTMPEPIARAAVDVAHAHHRLVFSHPSNLEGARVALRAGVDVLAHPPDSTEGVDETFLSELVQRKVAIIPTLKMFAVTVKADPTEYLEPIYRVVRRFRELGGQLLFGTDVGYMHDYSTEAEFLALERAGVPPSEMLRMLTSGPAERFGVDRAIGTVEVGKAADLVLLDGDPLPDVRAFARVRATLRAGRPVFSRTP